MTKYIKKILPALLFFVPLAGIISGCATAPPNELGQGMEMVPVGMMSKTTDAMESAVPEKVPFIFGAARVPGESESFWSAVINTSVQQQYKAVGYRTFCNLFVGDMLQQHFPPDIFDKVFPRGVLDPNVMHREWQANSEMIPLSPDEYTIRDIQDLANAGYLILLSYTWTYGHLAFVGNERMTVSTIPPSPRINGIRGNQLDSIYLPLVVQAGTYTGVTSAGYASNGWISSSGYPLFRNGTVRFYCVKK